jgi:NADPH-dependent 2,4-dienoyl-CoA reductase/sulfur reductase-like enzyme
MSVAYAIVKAGGNVSAIVDLSSKSEWVRVFPKMLSRPDLLLQGMKWLWKLKNEGIKIYNGYTVTKSEKDNDRLAITIAPFNHSGVNTDPKFQKLVEGECLAIGHGLIPSTEITRLLKAKHKYDLLKGGWVPVIDDEFRTSIPNVFIAGDASGISGAFSAVHKGRIAGLSALRDLNMISLKESKHKINNERNLLNKTENFGQAAAYLMRSRPELIKTITAETIVCRCEDVFRAEIDETIVSGAVDMNQLKAWTRCGMGPCQGRTCADSIEAILTSVVGSRELAGQWTGRAPLRPIPIEQIIGDYSYSDIPIPESAPL